MKIPQETGCCTIEMNNEGTTNGILSLISNFYEIEYNEEKDCYEVGGRN